MQPVTLAQYVPVEVTPQPRLASKTLATPATAPVAGTRRLTRGQVQRTLVLVVDDLGIAWLNMETDAKSAAAASSRSRCSPTTWSRWSGPASTPGIGQQLTSDKRHAQRGRRAGQVVRLFAA